MGAEGLHELVRDFLGLLGTSAAVYERNGDYALGIFSSGWCRLLDEASFRLCRTEDPREALACGRWLCHESCWREASLPSIRRGQPVDVACAGGIRLYAVPILVDGEVAGSINFGHGDPPDDPEKLALLAEAYDLPVDRLRQAIAGHPSRSDAETDEARRRLANAARLIGLIVERFQAQRRAREASRRYQVLFESMSQGVMYFDAEGRITEANPAACRILGRSPEELGDPSTAGSAVVLDAEGTRLPHDRVPAIRGLREARRIGGEVLGFPNPRDGQVHWVEGEVVPLLDPGQTRPHQICTVFTDVTERRQAEEALRESEARFRQIFEAAPLPMVISSAQGRCELLNLRFGEVFGYALEEVPDISAWYARAYPDPEYRRDVAERWKRNLAESRRHNRPMLPVEAEVTCKDGSVRNVEIRGTFIGLRLLGIFNDITELRAAEQERRRAEEQMRHVQKLESLGVLAGGIAHDFNNLLVAILGNADLALNTLPASNPARAFLEDIGTSSQRAAELCRQMLAYAGKGRFVLERVDLSEVVREMGHILQVSISKSATLRHDLDQDLPRVEADPSQLHQIVMNLITNASEALDDAGGVIAVTTGQLTCDREYLAGLYLGEEVPEGRYAFIEVADTGAGMSEATRERMFDPFFSTKFAGRGLGLAATLPPWSGSCSRCRSAPTR